MLDLIQRSLTDAPDATTFRHDKPTLLVAWWCTFYALSVILIRLLGRWVRTEKVFLDDLIMMLATIPLLLRMGFVHIVLTHGTNNTITTGLSESDILKRELGSKMVLVSRIMYAVYLWAIKYSVSVFLRTLTASVWQRQHARILRYLHFFLLATFLATVVADVASCQPFTHYWQVVPDPGPQCRQNFAHVITLGTMDVLTNLVLVIFPIPMILGSRLPTMYKFTILLRLALPLLPVFLTCFTLPHILSHHGQQTYRSLLASFSILLTAFSANAVVLSSLLQDKGYKKSKFKHVIEIAGKRTSSSARKRSYAEGPWADSAEDLIIQSNKMMKDGLEMGVLRKDEVQIEELKPAKLGDIRVASSWEITVNEAR